jgi:membrane protein implicated in regulation of membrane protease activity
MSDSALLTGLYAAGVQAAAVIVLVYVVVALMGTRNFAHPHDSAQPHPRPRRD